MEEKRGKREGGEKEPQIESTCWSTKQYTGEEVWSFTIFKTKGKKRGSGSIPCPMMVKTSVYCTIHVCLRLAPNREGPTIKARARDKLRLGLEIN